MRFLPLLVVASFTAWISFACWFAECGPEKPRVWHHVALITPLLLLLTAGFFLAWGYAIRTVLGG